MKDVNDSKTREMFNVPLLAYAKIREVRSPQRAHPHDAGIDFFVPEGYQCGLAHGESVLVPSGIRVNVPEGWALVFFNKSGVASKKSLDVMACVVDHGYQGEVHLNVINNGTEVQRINGGEKLLQGIMLPVGLHQPIEYEADELYQEASVRGTGGFGSTG